jgi:hypothetical protein
MYNNAIKTIITLDLKNMNILNPIPAIRQRFHAIESLLRDLNDTRDLHIYDETRKAELIASITVPMQSMGLVTVQKIIP